MPSVSKIIQLLSLGEETFFLQCQAYKLMPVREYQFLPGRKWRFDFCFVEPMIAIEIEGGTSFGKSRHSSGEGFDGDCRKYNAATALGWRVFRFSTAMVQKGEAIDLLLTTIFPEDL
jgi:very-short-patch-repair endonuclease